MKNNVIININDTSRPVIQNRKTYRDSILAEPITSGINLFKAILKENADFIKHEREDGEREQRNPGYVYSDWSFRVDNNIIAFMGDRGSGKTSAMLSTAVCLKDTSEYDDESDEGKRLRKCYFLQVIDPSFFDESHNILDLFIGELYKQFQIACKGKAPKYRDAQIRLQSSFDRLKSDMRYLEKPPRSFDDYEEGRELEFLCSGVYLQTNLRKMVQEFLEFIDKKTLVISIDDLDLNVQRCYEMMEQVRKYLIMPEAVIMLSGKIEQFHQAVQLKLLETYNHGQNGGNNSHHTLSYDVSEMADRYIAKLLPLNHRVYMPELSTLLDSPMTIVDGDKTEEFGNLSDGVLDMIFQKTRYLFYNSRDSKSLIIPRNLRNLNHLVRLLYDMPDFDRGVRVTTEDTPAARNNRSNQARFKNYFFTEWLNQLSSERIEQAKSLIMVQEPAQFNKCVIGCVGNRYYTEDNLERITDTNNVTYNVSLGDVLTLISHTQKTFTDQDDLLFIFFVKSLYSMRLYELYDRMTDELKSVEASEPSTAEQRPILRNSELAGVSDLVKLIGGAYFSPDRFDELILDGRDRRVLNGNYINRTIRSLVEEYNKAVRGTEGGEPDMPDAFMKMVRMMEFFAYTSQRYIQAKDYRRLEGMNDNFRTTPYPFYLRPLSSTSNIIFDATAPLFRCIDPEATLSVYGKGFKDMCMAMSRPGKMSLTHMLLLENRRYDGVPLKADLASRVTLRNTEVITDVYGYLLNHRDRYRAKGDDEIGIYSDFFAYLSRYNQKSYFLDAGQKVRHEITLLPMQCFANVLEDISHDGGGLAATFRDCFANYTENIPEKGSEASQKIMQGYIYPPSLVRSIVSLYYPEYEKDHNIREKLKSPNLNRSDGEGIVRYLVKGFKGDLDFSAAIGDDMMSLYQALMIQVKNDEAPNDAPDQR